ncbi:MAG: hypothetical protein NVS4B3_01220 [Gemmatimonadaceae bacterium]
MRARVPHTERGGETDAERPVPYPCSAACALWRRGPGGMEPAQAVIADVLYSRGTGAGINHSKETL